MGQKWPAHGPRVGAGLEHDAQLAVWASWGNELVGKGFHLRTARALKAGVQIIEEHKFFVSVGSIERGVTMAFRFVLGYLWLAHSAHANNTRCYKLRPKPPVYTQREGVLRILGLAPTTVSVFCTAEATHLATYVAAFEDFSNQPENKCVLRRRRPGAKDVRCCPKLILTRKKRFPNLLCLRPLGVTTGELLQMQSGASCV